MNLEIELVIKKLDLSMFNLKFISLVFVLLYSSQTFSQIKFEIPHNVKLIVKEDYTKYTNDIINATRWLEETDLNKDERKRKDVDSFVLKWIMGCPMFNIELGYMLPELFQKNNYLLLIYMGSYSRYFLTHKEKATEFLGIKAGLISVINIYKKGIKMNENTEMNTLIKQYEISELDKYIQDHFQYLFR